MSNPAIHLTMHTTPPTASEEVMKILEPVLLQLVEQGMLLDYWPGATESGDPGGWRWSIEIDRGGWGLDD